MLLENMTDVLQPYFCCLFNLKGHLTSYVIDAYVLEILIPLSNAQWKTSGIGIVNTQVSRGLLTSVNVRSATAWLKSYVLEDWHYMKLLVIPVNIANCHWGLLIVRIQSRTIEWYDGLGMNPTSEVELLCQQLIHTLEHVYTLGKSASSLSDWIFRFARGTRQANSHDCGVYVLDFMRSLVSTDGLMGTRLMACNVKDVRLRFALELLEIQLSRSKCIFDDTKPSCVLTNPVRLRIKVTGG
jgi:hypothetical protein